MNVLKGIEIHHLFLALILRSELKFYVEFRVADSFSNNIQVDFGVKIHPVLTNNFLYFVDRHHQLVVGQKLEVSMIFGWNPINMLSINICIKIS